jgi:hypothetical protein
MLKAIGQVVVLEILGSSWQDTVHQILRDLEIDLARKLLEIAGCLKQQLLLYPIGHEFVPIPLESFQTQGD